MRRINVWQPAHPQAMYFIKPLHECGRVTRYRYTQRRRTPSSPRCASGSRRAATRSPTTTCCSEPLCSVKMCSEPLRARAGGCAERNPAATGRAKGEARLERHADWMARCEMVEASRHSLCASHVSQHAIQKQACSMSLLCLVRDLLAQSEAQRLVTKKVSPKLPKEAAHL